MRASVFHLSLLAVFLPAAAMAADELPKRKPGLWEIHNEMNGRPSPAGPIQTCIDATTDNIMQQRASDMSSKCEQTSWKNNGDKFTMKSVCKFDKSTATTEATFTGAFDSNYRGELHMTYDPPMHGLAKSDMTISAKWLGPCKAGQKAGDIILPSMGRMGGPGGMNNIPNMNELMKMQEQMKKMQGR